MCTDAAHTLCKNEVPTPEKVSNAGPPEADNPSCSFNLTHSYHQPRVEPAENKTHPSQGSRRTQNRTSDTEHEVGNTKESWVKVGYTHKGKGRKRQSFKFVGFPDFISNSWQRKKKKKLPLCFYKHGGTAVSTSIKRDWLVKV